MGEAFQLRPDGLTHIPAQIAASWARAGFPVFPCGQDKRPLTPHGFKDATADLQAVAAFWQAHPKALVGLPTGPTSGLFVVDLDIDKATGEAIGEASLAALGLSQLIGAVPTVATPSGGRHLYFRDCGLGNSTGKLGPKIDTRGAGGYVIAPGSVTANGAYSLLTGPFTPEALTSVPEALTARLRGVADPDPAQPALRIDTGASAPGWAEAALHGELGRVMAAREGERNHALNRAAFSLGQIIAGGGLDGASTRARLLSAALANGLSEAEAQATIASGMGAGMESPRTAPERSNMSAAQRLAPTEAECTTAPAPTTLRPFEAWKPIDPATIPRIRFVYGDSYAAGYMTVTFAAPKTGKSLLGIAEAVDATTGRGFLTGRETAPQAVLYYNAEDDQDVLNARALAVLTANAIPQEDVAERFFPVSGIADDRQLVLIRGEKNEINEAAFVFLAEMIARHGIALANCAPNAPARPWGIAPDPMQDRIEARALADPHRVKAREAKRQAKARVICGAKTRAGHPCGQKSEPGKRRCKWHGGKSTGPKTPEGKARIAEAQRQRWADVSLCASKSANYPPNT